MKLKRVLLIMTAAVLLISGCKRPRNDGSPQPSAVTNTPAPTAMAEPSAAPVQTASPAPETPKPTAETIPEDTECDDKDCVVSYLIAWKKLPSNYMTKKEARKLGWKSGTLYKVAEGRTLGGDRFWNLEGLLPERDDYHECDLNDKGKKRGPERLIYSEDVEVIYYTADHYESFELIHGDEK